MYGWGEEIIYGGYGGYGGFEEIIYEGYGNPYGYGGYWW